MTPNLKDIYKNGGIVETRTFYLNPELNGFPIEINLILQRKANNMDTPNLLVVLWRRWKINFRTPY